MRFLGSQKNKGFSLIEALVAVSIFVFAILTPLRIANQSLLSSVFTKDQIIALGLARDGVEFINYWRSVNSATGEFWTNGIFVGDAHTMCGNSVGCKVDTSVTAGNITLNSDNAVLRLDPVTGRYGYDGSWTPTKYTRVIYVTGIDNADDPWVGIAVEAKVSWELTPGFTRSVTIKEFLFNWITEEKK